jgi:hypothetical protein
MIRSINIIIFIILGVNNYVLSQGPSIKWQKTFGGSLSDQAYSICSTSDGGFAIVGLTFSSDGDVSNVNNIYIDVWLIKIDSIGNLLWEKCLGGSSDDEGYKILQTSDHGFIIYGKTNSPNDGDVSGLHIGMFPLDDGWLIKTDSLGHIEWQHCYGGTDFDWGSDLKITDDGGYLLSEVIRSNDGDIANFHGEYDYWLVKVDYLGNIIWSKTFGGISNDLPACCAQTTDGNYIIAGISEYNFGGLHTVPGIGGHDLGIVKTDSMGNVIWSKCFGGGDLEEPYSIIASENGSFYIIAENTSNDGDLSAFYGASDAWILKIDSAGGIIWQKSFGGNGYDIPSQIIKTIDGGLIFVCTTSSNDLPVINYHGQIDFLVVKLDSLGDVEWEKCLGGSLDEYAQSIVQTQDGSYTICGYTSSFDGDVVFNHGEDDFWVIQLESTNTSTQEIIDPIKDLKIIIDNNNLNIRFTSEISKKGKLLLSDVCGRELLMKNIFIEAGSNNLDFIYSQLSSGLYFITLSTESDLTTRKIFIN